MERRVHVHYSGDVQGVGFRYTARAVARRHPVAGFVRNLPDGRVEVVAEGEESSLKEFLADVKDKMRMFRFSDMSAWQDPTGEFDSFQIAF